MRIADARREAGALVGLTGSAAVVMRKGRHYHAASREWFERNGIDEGWAIVEEVEDNPSSPLRRRRGEKAIAYHDRLVLLGKEMSKIDNHRLANEAFAIAGTIAKHNEPVRSHRRKTQGGPGTYPFGACMKDAMARYGNKQQAGRVCGFIRNTSKMTYPAYWQARGD